MGSPTAPLDLASSDLEKSSSRSLRLRRLIYRVLLKENDVNQLLEGVYFIKEASGVICYY